METQTFFTSWDRYMTWGASLFVGFALLILLYHEFQIFQIKDYKKKYDYVNLHEIRYFWYAVIAFIFAFAIYGNTIGTERITSSTQGMLWFFVRLFLTISFGVIAYFVFFSTVRIYYPRSVEKRLAKLRNAARISPSGNTMRKLGKDEEDVHLEASQVVEKNSEIHSVNYDVWIDENTGFKKVEKYFSYQHTEACPQCGYVTLKVDHEEVTVSPTTSEPGELVKHYKCGYCAHREQKQVVLSKMSENIA